VSDVALPAHVEPFRLPEVEPILVVSDLVKVFPIRAGIFRRVVGGVQAVSGVSFTVGKGQTVGLVGESGCGKSTTGRLVLRLIEPTAGSVVFDDADVIKHERYRPGLGKITAVLGER